MYFRIFRASYCIVLKPSDPAESHPNSMYIETEHGGHLGFYDGGYIAPQPATWIDKTIVSIVTGLANRDSF